MNCDQLKQAIYLYDELTKAEQKLVDNHIAQNSKCAHLFREMQQQQAIVRKAATWREYPKDAGKLTQKIMSSVKANTPKPAVSFNSVINRINITSVRLALTALSLFLVVFFISEYNATSQHGQQNKSKQNVSIHGKGIVLNSASLVKPPKLKKNQSSFMSVYQCLRLCRFGENRNLCDECKSGLKKLSKAYESH